MGWKEVKRRMSVPILTSDGISAMIDSCLEKDGKNKSHSRTIIMDGYKAPVDDEKSVSNVKIENIKFDIIRYMAQSLLKDCNISDPSKTISQFVSGWKEKNLELDVTIRELQEIATMSDEDIKKLNTEKSGDNIGGFINKVYETSCELEKEHNGANPIYPFEKVSNLEKNTTCEYNKRIYLNPSLENITTYKFLSEYIKKCIDKRIPFDMKGFGSMKHSKKQLDGMILYSSNKYFNQHLECLEEVIRENPEMMETFGTPIYTGAMINDENNRAYYTVCAGYPCRMHTYNDYIDSAINMTYLTASAKLIKQYFPAIISDYRELDEETRILIYRLNNIEECTLEELRSIRNAQKETIRCLAHKIITHKREKGTEQEKEEVMGKLRATFSNNFKVICSALKFNDKTHINTPVYKDGSFLDFERQIRSRDIVEADNSMGIASSETYEAEKMLENIKEKQDKKEKVKNKMEFQNGKEDFINKLNINFRTLLTYGKDELIQVGEFIVKDIVMDEIPNEYVGLMSPRDTARVVFQEVENENVELVLPFNEFMTKYIELANKNASTLDIESNLEKSLSKVEKEAAIKIFNDETLKNTTEVDTLTLEESQAEYFRDGKPQSSNYSICPINLGKCRERIRIREYEMKNNNKDDGWER